MAWGAAIGAIAGGALSYMGSQQQADAAEGATQREIDFARDRFDYARGLQRGVLRQQEPRRIASQRATRSLSMMAGLGDPGASAPAYEQQRLSDLKDQISETDKFVGGGPDLSDFEKRTFRGQEMWIPKGESFSPSKGLTTEEVLSKANQGDRRINPEYERLQSEIDQLESELGESGGSPGGEGATEFDGPKDITELPGYDFIQEQGLEALSRSGAAQGMQLSGAQMKDITRFGQGHASKFRGQLIGELQSMAGMRPSSQGPANAISSQAGAASQQVGGALSQLGAIRASEAAGQYGALGSTFNQLGQIDYSGGNTGGNFGGVAGNLQGTSAFGGGNTYGRAGQGGSF